jgi:hypothetical protein
MTMTRKDLDKLISDEVSKVVREPMREPAPPAVAPTPIVHFRPALKDESEVDEYLFKAGMKEH